jgi:hypothetical protein
VGTDDEMAPRVQLGSVPFAVQALTVPDGSVTTGKIADGAVTQAKFGADVSLTPPDGSITTAKLADGAVTSSKISDDTILRTSGPMQAKVQYGRTLFWTDICDFITVTFPQPFTSTPVVLITQTEASLGPGDFVAFSVTPTDFKVHKFGSNCATHGWVSWIAIGS